jgi:hypothetical protein
MKSIAVVPAAVLLALVTLAVVSDASAKGSAPSQACGAKSCKQLDGSPESLIVLDGDARRTSPSPAPYYRIEYAASGVGPHYFVPSGSLLAVETAGGRALQWYALYGTGPARLRKAIRDLEPYKAPAEWPTRVEARVVARDSGMEASVWLFGGLLVAVAAGAVVASRVRVRRPKTA